MGQTSGLPVVRASGPESRSTETRSRRLLYPFTNTIGLNTPENFRAALEKTKQRLLAQPGGPRILTINCWNEWTEGSYLEPDTVHGTKYLEAVREVFGG